MKNNTFNPHANMEEWNPKFRYNSCSSRFEKFMRSCTLEKDGFTSSLFDHWGTVDRADAKGRTFQALITQPYKQEGVDFPAQAQAFAKRLGCVLAESRMGGPWHPDTWYFEFHPPEERYSS